MGLRVTVLSCRVLHEGKYAAGHEPGCPHRLPVAGQLTHLYDAALITDINPAACLGRGYLVCACAVTRINHDFNFVAYQMVPPYLVVCPV